MKDIIIFFSVKWLFIDGHEVVTFGSGSYGQLGNGTRGDKKNLSPLNAKYFPNNSKVSCVSCGDYYTVIVFGHGRTLLQSKLVQLLHAAKLVDVIFK